MSLFNVFDIAGSGLSAQSVRLNATTSNLANADSVSSSIDQTYRARHPVFAATLQQVKEQQAGVGVQVLGVVESQARALNPGFIKRMESGIPYVRCKLALSLDGRSAMASGESQWITGPDARRDVQFLRARSSAILTGIGTVLADDPSLTCRMLSATTLSL